MSYYALRRIDLRCAHFIHSSKKIFTHLEEAHTTLAVAIRAKDVGGGGCHCACACVGVCRWVECYV